MPHPSPRPSGREPGIYVINLPDEGEAMYMLYDSTRRRVARITLPLDAATERVEDQLEDLLGVVEQELRRAAVRGPHLRLEE